MPGIYVFLYPCYRKYIDGYILINTVQLQPLGEEEPKQLKIYISYINSDQ